MFVVPNLYHLSVWFVQIEPQSQFNPWSKRNFIPSSSVISGFKLETIAITFSRSIWFIIPRPCPYTKKAIAEMTKTRIAVPCFIFKREYYFFIRTDAHF